MWLSSPFSPDLRRQRQSLLARINRRYKTLHESLDIGSGTFCFTRISDPNSVLAEFSAQASTQNQYTTSDVLHLPYWAELWDSSLGIAQWLGGQSLQNVRLLDLGCGMGLTGSIAASLGARVLFADLEPSALLFARLNSLPWHQRVRTRRLDWSADHLREHFDLILGTDILYEVRQWGVLESFWRQHLARRGRVVLGEPGRSSSDAFIDWIQLRGWRLIRQSVSIPTRSSPIRIFIIDEPR
ncbi:MAG: methyltransferase [Phycisphaerales bacterium]|nr:methyltransferase [Phycisphaerales bacterium]